jgi:ribonuclease P protein component
VHRARPVGRFPKAQRVRRRKEFKEAQRRGRSVRTRHFVLLLHARFPSDDSAPRLGIVASRKVGNAVKRNRAKRLVREAFRATRDLIPPGIDLVVIIRQNAHLLKLYDVVDEWRHAAPVIERRIGEARADRERRAATAP